MEFLPWDPAPHSEVGSLVWVPGDGFGPLVRPPLVQPKWAHGLLDSELVFGLKNGQELFLYGLFWAHLLKKLSKVKQTKLKLKLRTILYKLQK